MATPRLPFLWPMLWKPQNAPRTRPRARAPRSKRAFATTPSRCIEAPIQRYGTAHEPAPHLRSQPEKKDDPVPPKIPHDPAKDVEEDDEEPEGHLPTEPPATPAQPGATEEAPQKHEPPAAPKTGEQKPLDSVLHMPGPSEEEHKPPHLKTPPYVHHFDTYGLVQQLSKSAYTDAQSITLMKAVRGLLISNMMLAREGLVSKSNVENETYLFRAACAELRTEIGNTRRGEVDKWRSERVQLQHEVDILGQKLGQETGSVKDELKGLFDDRKMAVRQEQRSMETKVQELNYQITIKLNSDARSEVEGLRWVLTRRIAMGIATMATMVVILLQLNSSRKHEHKEEQKKKDDAGKNGGSGDGGRGLEPQRLGLSNITAVGAPGQEEALGGELLATEGVSLG
ncbi:uncharacterized protein M421DRAFT_207242 [Didymella exigua CBS 183.55]|uniref:DUF1640-domain-containing protein n=1 Tax=Didymella exigua CBS 183.55 TaxID=1150837 RepID=A0A6A5REW2_9PLEO|nr:uncharacterized protein M421DRAFT_207242 [Didymella exigua CBS 183.55]KAF1926805.1 hypothetical protein M421DRAFT_207242 [Didymella exigua CBS 183.55]